LRLMVRASVVDVATLSNFVGDVEVGCVLMGWGWGVGSWGLGALALERFYCRNSFLVWSRESLRDKRTHSHTLSHTISLSLSHSHITHTHIAHAQTHTHTHTHTHERT
jgi:hypothetical protein